MTKKKTTRDSEIADLKKQIEELKTGWQRTQADFLNFQKRMENEKSQDLKFAKAQILAKLTPVLDNFCRALSEEPSNNPFVLGIKQIQKQLEDILTGEGLEKITDSPGTKFDPNFHEAISYEKNDQPKDTVIDVFESGWMFAGRVLKPAKVRVSQGK